MPTQPLVPYDFLVAQGIAITIDEIRTINPHRYEMEHITAVVHLDRENKLVAGYKDVGDKEFWVRGHLPGRPLLPGVIMIEAGAQLSSILFHKIIPNTKFFGFAAIDEVRFRGTVVPGDRLYLISRGLDLRPSRGHFHLQGMVAGKIVFEAKILGMSV